MRTNYFTQNLILASKLGVTGLGCLLALKGAWPTFFWVNPTFFLGLSVGIDETKHRFGRHVGVKVGGANFFLGQSKVLMRTIIFS